MCSKHRRGRERLGRRSHLGRFGNREDWLARLEEYQRDLEQELADVADVIRRLREGPPESRPQTASI